MGGLLHSALDAETLWLPVPWASCVFGCVYRGQSSSTIGQCAHTVSNPCLQFCRNCFLCATYRLACVFDSVAHKKRKPVQRTMGTHTSSQSGPSERLHVPPTRCGLLCCRFCRKAGFDAAAFEVS